MDELGRTEADRLTEARWSVAEEMLGHQPQTIVDLAWQAEAYLLTDLELFEPPNEWSDWMIRAVFQHIRTLGALTQPVGALAIAA